MYFQEIRNKIKYFSLIFGILITSSFFFIGYSAYQFREEWYLSTSGKERIMPILSKIEQLKSKEKIQRYYKENNWKELREIFAETQKNYLDLQKIFKTKILSKVFLSVKEGEGLLNYAEEVKSESIVSLLQKKLNELTEIAKKEEWKRIEQILTVMGEQLNKNQTANMLMHIRAIRNLSLSSKLEDQQKQQIETYLSDLEQTMTKMSDIRDIDKKWFDWLDIFESQKDLILTDIRLQLANTSNRIEYSYRVFVRNLLLSAFLFLFLLISFYLIIQKLISDGQNYVEEKLDIFLRDDVFVGDPQILELVSPEHRSSTKRHLKNLLQKLDLGLEFEAGVPLSCFILDHDFRLVWANDLFLEEFAIPYHDLGKEYIDWKYLSQYLNFGELDPVEKTSREKVPGVYQIKVSTNNQIKSYELHISPMQTGSGDKIFLLLYPLTFLEESLKSQTDLLTHPLKVLLPLVAQKNLEEEKLDLIQFQLSELKKASHDGLAQDFELLITRSKNNFLYHERIIDDLTEKNHDLTKLNFEFEQLFDSIKLSFKTIKDQTVRLALVYQSTQNLDKISRDVNLNFHKEIKHLNLGLQLFQKTNLDLEERIKDAEKYLHQVLEIIKSENVDRHLEGLVTKSIFTLNIFNLQQNRPDVQHPAQTSASLQSLILALDEMIASFDLVINDLVKEEEKVFHNLKKIQQYTFSSVSKNENDQPSFLS